MEKVKKAFFKYKLNVILIAIIIFGLALFLRIYKLDTLPAGINVDEAGMAYDAYCLSNYSTDRYLNTFPVYLINFGQGQSVMYAYVTALLIKLIGFNRYAIRLPQVILNMLAIILSFFMFKKFLGYKKASIIALLFAIAPWNIMSSRWGLDCNLLAPMLLVSLFFITRAKKWYDYFIAGIVTGLVLYTYALSYIVMPIFLFLLLIYMLYTKKIKIKNCIIFALPLGLVATPLILFVLVNMGVIEEITGVITIPEIPFFRTNEISTKYFLDNIKNLYFMFIYDDLPFNSIREYGTVYNFALIFGIIGILKEIYSLIKNIIKREFEINTVIFILFTVQFIFYMNVYDPHISKANGMYFPFIFLVFSGLYTIVSIIKKLGVFIKHEKVAKILEVSFIIVIAILYSYNFAGFCYEYFYNYNNENANMLLFDSELIDTIKQVNEREEFNGKTCDIITSTRQPYIYALLADPISPEEFLDTLNSDWEYGRFIVNRLDYVDDYVYVISNDSDGNTGFIVELIVNHGFTTEYKGFYTIAYKTN